jgi:hypothetical protein
MRARLPFLGLAVDRAALRQRFVTTEVSVRDNSVNARLFSIAATPQNTIAGAPHLMGRHSGDVSEYRQDQESSAAVIAARISQFLT